MFRPRAVEFDGFTFRMAEEAGGFRKTLSVPLKGYGQGSAAAFQPVLGEKTRPGELGPLATKRQMRTRRGAVSLHVRESMTTLSCRVATTQRQLDDALRIRWPVFGKELGLLGSTA